MKNLEKCPLHIEECIREAHYQGWDPECPDFCIDTENAKNEALTAHFAKYSEFYRNIELLQEKQYLEGNRKMPHAPRLHLKVYGE